MKRERITRRSLAGALASGLAVVVEAPAVPLGSAQAPAATKAVADEAAEALQKNAAAVSAAVADSQIDPAFRFVT